MIGSPEWTKIGGDYREEIKRVCPFWWNES